jgi:hypothetical protein
MYEFEIKCKEAVQTFIRDAIRNAIVKKRISKPGYTSYADMYKMSLISTMGFESPKS